jgi:hypothetical protein
MQQLGPELTSAVVLQVPKGDSEESEGVQLHGEAVHAAAEAFEQVVGSISGYHEAEAKCVRSLHSCSCKNTFVVFVLQTYGTPAVEITPGPRLNLVLGPNGEALSRAAREGGAVVRWLMSEPWVWWRMVLQQQPRWQWLGYSGTACSNMQQQCELSCVDHRQSPESCLWVPLSNACFVAGTGKSSLVCALCLGLTGGPKVGNSLIPHPALAAAMLQHHNILYTAARLQAEVLMLNKGS